MAVQTKTRRRSTKKPKHVGKKATVEAIFESYGLPGWLGWGTMGAESTYGTNGSYAFGGIALPNSGNGNWPLEARESAKAYAGLVKTYGSVAAAVPHYSGNSYEIDHVKELAGGGGPQANEAVSTAQLQTVSWDPRNLSPLWRLFHGEAPLPEFPGEDLIPGIPNPAGGDLGDVPGNALGLPGEILQAASATTAFLSMLTDVKFWIRFGTAVAGFILIYMGLHALTGQGPGAGDIIETGKNAGTAAATKGL